MFPNLIGQAKSRKLSNDDMGKLLGVTRQTYVSKLQNGTFTYKDIIKLTVFFKTNFEYLFYTDGEQQIGGENNGNRI